jgi:hypothetical protein
MSRSVSVGAMIEQLDGLRDTRDLSDWEEGFVTSILHRYLQAGRRTSSLSAMQVEKIEQIWQRHFA